MIKEGEEEVGVAFATDGENGEGPFIDKIQSDLFGLSKKYS